MIVTENLTEVGSGEKRRMETPSINIYFEDSCCKRKQWNGVMWGQESFFNGGEEMLQFVCKFVG